jgi:serine/threonine protein kinase
MGCGGSSTAVAGMKNTDGMMVYADAYSKRRYTKLKELGCGASCSVDSVEDKDFPGQHYALKRLNKKDPMHPTLWRQEYQLLGKLKHPNVLAYIDAFEEKESFCIVTGLCEGGELFDRVAQGHFSEKVQI